MSLKPCPFPYGSNYSGPLGPKKQKTGGDKSYADRIHCAKLSNSINYMELNL